MAASPIYRYLTPLIHVLVWVLFGLTFLVFQPLSGRIAQIALPSQFWVKQGVLFVAWIAVFYFTARVTVPRLLLQGRTGWFVAAVLATAALSWLLGWSLDKLLHLPELMTNAFAAAKVPPPPFRRPGSFRFDTNLLTTLLVLGISTSTTVVQKWQKDTLIRQTLEQEKIASELSLLKAQINPHFFFNTLNNIYALTIIDGEQARAALHRLSRMMRYVLYDSSGGTTRLSQEISFVLDYIDLMQLRLTDRVTVTFDRPDPVQDVLIAPMLLLPYVENAFKHGVAATKASRIYIALRQPTPQVLELEVRNSLLIKPSTDLAGSNGIGLTNTRRRLDLLYPDRFTLHVDEHTPDNEFRVHLTIQLA